ncbi:L,D-transpeptidase family protein [Desulfogranum japonicum]|uniref:L,D-transpeptidase family protein n=1 Tax=Desulfogranum japonicum TaxID=231447 RepID=UPI000414C208|nr:L,D-transpeptidase family protein [Desulfogranum japonicum]
MITGKPFHCKNTILSSLACCIISIALLFFSACTNNAATLPIPSPPTSNQNVSQQDAFAASLIQYQKLLQQKPKFADRILFEMGIAYSHPKNTGKDYQKATACFQRIIDDFPESKYRDDSQMMLFQVSNVLMKDQLIDRQRQQADAYRRQIKEQESQITNLRGELDNLRQKIFTYSTIPIDKILIEKHKRRLTLLSQGVAIKTYEVALGKNPVGPKEQQGDGKTPEGLYFIESRNRLSKYHLSLRLSYPNQKDTMRSQSLGVSPGGDIMIHGLKNGHPDIGTFHATLDWTDGCIAVTNEEIEEIAQIVPDGTPVEIQP